MFPCSFTTQPLDRASHPFYVMSIINPLDTVNYLPRGGQGIAWAYVKHQHVTLRFSPKVSRGFSSAVVVELPSLSPRCISFIFLFDPRVPVAAMSFPTQAAARCARQLSGSVRPSSLRIATSYTARTPSSRRWESTEAAAAAPTNPKIAQIVDQISTLTLLETADLVSSLKVGDRTFFRRCIEQCVNCSPFL